MVGLNNNRSPQWSVTWRDGYIININNAIDFLKSSHLKPDIEGDLECSFYHRRVQEIANSNKMTEH